MQPSDSLPFSKGKNRLLNNGINNNIALFYFYELLGNEVFKQLSLDDLLALMPMLDGEDRFMAWNLLKSKVNDLSGWILVVKKIPDEGAESDEAWAYIGGLLSSFDARLNLYSNFSNDDLLEEKAWQFFLENNDFDNPKFIKNLLESDKVSVYRFSELEKFFKEAVSKNPNLDDIGYLFSKLELNDDEYREYLGLCFSLNPDFNFFHYFSDFLPENCLHFFQKNLWDLADSFDDGMLLMRIFAEDDDLSSYLSFLKNKARNPRDFISLYSYLPEFDTDAPEIWRKVKSLVKDLNDWQWLWLSLPPYRQNERAETWGVIASFIKKINSDKPLEAFIPKKLRQSFSYWHNNLN